MEPISHANTKAGSALVCSAAEDIEATAAALVLRRMLQQQNVGLTRALSLLEELPESQALDELVRMTSLPGWRFALWKLLRGGSGGRSPFLFFSAAKSRNP